MSPELDHLRGRPNHEYATSCVKNKLIGAIVFELRQQTDKQTDIPKCTSLALPSGSQGNFFLNQNDTIYLLLNALLHRRHKGKGMVLYSAVSSPLDRSKRFTLSSPGRPVHSDTVLGFSWKHSSHMMLSTSASLVPFHSTGCICLNLCLYYYYYIFIYFASAPLSRVTWSWSHGAL